jgi:hypothetical protein
MIDFIVRVIVILGFWVVASIVAGAAYSLIREIDKKGYLR